VPPDLRLQASQPAPLQLILSTPTKDSVEPPRRRQHRRSHILRGQQRHDPQIGPGDADGRIVPAHGPFACGRVEVRGLVEKVRAVAGHDKPVREARRDPELAVVLARQLDPDPLTEGRAALAQVDRDIKHGALRAANELALRVRWQLVMQPAQHALGRARVVVLHKVHVVADGLVEDLLVVALHEEAASVPEDLGLQDEDIGDGSADDVHVQRVLQ
jgi:hypothetical protein